MKWVGLGISLPRTDQDVLRRLADHSRDAEALIAVYEHYEAEIRGAAVNWFGNKHGLYEQAVNNILVAIGREAGTYDPQSMNASEWVSRVAEAEGRRLLEALDAGGSRGRRTRRAM